MNPKQKSPADRPGNESLQDQYNINDTGSVSFFASFSDKQPKTVQASELVEAIRGGKWRPVVERLRQLKQTDPEAYDKEKLSLPFFTMAGTFSKRNKAGFLMPSGYIILDIDGLPVDQLSEIRARIESDQHAAICFLSPSGVGLKVAFRVSISNDIECKAAFAAISEYFRSKYQIELDQSGKDISRACFISFDPVIYYNPDAVQFGYEVAASGPEQRKQTDITIPARYNPRLAGYILGALNGELENIYSAPAGTGTKSLYRAAIIAGELSYTGLFCRNLIKERFIEAFLQRGNSFNTREHAERVFDNGWNIGKNQYRQMPSEVLS